jgi:hypothetical protein
LPRGNCSKCSLREREQPTPFVGREDELELLAGHVRRTVATDAAT